MARLRRSDCSAPGIKRRRAGKGFVYLDPKGTRVADSEVLARIRGLAIPPAWTDVWICQDPLGHLQAIGTDAAGRRQYLYHPTWRTTRDRKKFGTMIEFAESLPRLRKVVDECLRRPDMDRERVLACAVRMLDRGLFRIGSEEYTRKNQTFGLATILKSQVKVEEGGKVTCDYPAKGGIRQIRSIVDPDAALVVSQLKRRRQGTELLAYRSDNGWLDVKAKDINEFIKWAAGGDFSAKNFRTWSATVLAAVSLAGMGDRPPTKTAGKRAVSAAVKQVAEQLGNTPAVCRSSYIYPRVIDDFLSGSTIAHAIKKLDPADLEDASMRHVVEKAVLELIEGYAPSSAKVA
jgi:DNA topoisomerase-1